MSTVSILHLVVAVIIASAAAMSPSSPPPSQSSKCAVFGVGVLGTSLCRQILKSNDPDYTVTGITKTSDRHSAIREEVGSELSDRLELVTNDQTAASGRKYKNVVFCAPPSGFEDYPAAVKDAAENIWAGPDAGGLFVFTSSGAIYGSGDGESSVTESTPPPDDAMDSPRMARLLAAEKASIEAGGCCLRLAGLYNLQRGAHNYWITSGKDEFPSYGDGIINLLHYDDAAGACASALKRGGSACGGKIFLISDGHPMTRNEICASALQAKLYAGDKAPKFVGPADEGMGKIYDGSRSNELLNWEAKYESFDAFMKANA